MPDLPQDVANRVKKLSKGVLPPGGTGGRVLRKASNDDYDVAWQPDDGGLPPGGTVGQVVTKRSYVDGDADWETPTSGVFSVAVDAYLDATGISIAGGTESLPWVVDPGPPGGAVSLPSAGLLDLSTPDTPIVLADGYFTFDMFVAAVGTLADDNGSRALYKIERGADVALFQPTHTPVVSGVSAYVNSYAFSFSYPCLAGDVVTIQIEDDVTNTWALGGSVKSIT